MKKMESGIGWKQREKSKRKRMREWNWMKKNKLAENTNNEKKGNLRRAKVENSIATMRRTVRWLLGWLVGIKKWKEEKDCVSVPTGNKLNQLRWLKWMPGKRWFSIWAREWTRRQLILPRYLYVFYRCLLLLSPCNSPLLGIQFRFDMAASFKRVTLFEITTRDRDMVRFIFLKCRLVTGEGVHSKHRSMHNNRMPDRWLTRCHWIT